MSRNRLVLDTFTRAELGKLTGELRTVRELLAELAGRADRIAAALNGGAAHDAQPELADEAAHDAQPNRAETPEPEPEPKAELPERVRSSPFQRQPRIAQVDWLLELMADGRWTTAVEITAEFANEPREVRYMRGWISTRLRELWEEGLLDRQSSTIRGAMFAYRLSAPTPAPLPRVG